jgi:hypothetical protein
MSKFNSSELIEFARAMDVRKLESPPTTADCIVALRAALFPDSPEVWTAGLPEQSAEATVHMAELAITQIRGGSNV